LGSPADSLGLSFLAKAGDQVTGQANDRAHPDSLS
jgi:hypothetical protein